MFNRLPVYLVAGYSVHLEISLEGRPVRAVKTTERFLTSVNAQVSLQVGPVSELSAAKLADIIPLPLVFFLEEIQRRGQTPLAYHHVLLLYEQVAC